MTREIIPIVRGGLGNQMFQIGFAKIIASKFDASISINIEHFSKQTTHNGFEVEKVFCLHLPKYNFTFYDVALRHMSNIVARLLRKSVFLSFPRMSVLSEYKMKEVADKFSQNGRLVLDGYFQYGDIFYSNRDLLFNYFRFNVDSFSGEIDQIAEQMSDTNSVCVHIRRGDYVTNRTANGIHGTVENNYYEAALNFIVMNTTSPTLFIFSDDLKEAAKMAENWPVKSYVVDINRGDQSYKDIYLMTCCKHHIIANSSFSWWGAFLRRSSAGHVIAPRQWFAGEPSLGLNVCPTSWIRM